MQYFIQIIAMVLLVSANSVAFAQSSAPSQILIQNVQVFDGTSTSLSVTTDVLITGNKIEKISIDAGKGISDQAQVIDGGGYASPTDPIMSSQYTLAELQAAVDAATDWGDLRHGSRLYAMGDKPGDRCRR